MKSIEALVRSAARDIGAHEEVTDSSTKNNVLRERNQIVSEDGQKCNAFAQTITTPAANKLHCCKHPKGIAAENQSIATSATTSFALSVSKSRYEHFGECPKQNGSPQEQLVPDVYARVDEQLFSLFPSDDRATNHRATSRQQLQTNHTDMPSVRDVATPMP